MTKYILVGGYPHKATDGGKAFAEELVKGFDEPVKILICLFARPEDNWEKAYAQDVEFFTRHLAGKSIEIRMARSEGFLTQVKWADAIYIRGGDLEEKLISLIRGMGGFLEALKGKTLAGSSAGAHAISKYYFELYDQKLCEGLGILPIKTLVHYRASDNYPKIDWDGAEEELRAYRENLPILKLAEGQFEVISKN